MIKHIKNQVSAVNKTFENFRDSKCDTLVKDCIKTISRNNRIIATGLGKNGPICEKFVGTLNSVGIDAHFLNTNSAVHGDLGIVKRGDLVIMLSKSGETFESVYLAKLFKRRNIKVWLLTCSKSSSIQKIISNAIVIPLEKEEDPWDLVPNCSTLVFLIFLQALSMELIDRLKISLKTFKNNHPGGGIGIKLNAQ